MAQQQQHEQKTKTHHPRDGVVHPPVGGVAMAS